ncbi:MAG: hypothetical protein KF734_00105 [Saprospiraceae bacterium]|nr:hypothetical protein [Saprospiraceae bacterium]
MKKLMRKGGASAQIAPHISRFPNYTQMQIICEVSLIDNNDFQGFKRAFLRKSLFVEYGTSAHSQIVSLLRHHYETNHHRH